MNLTFRVAVAMLSLLCVFSRTLLPNSQKDNTVTQRATGPFEVKVVPLDPAFQFDENPIGHFSLDKQFHGDLEATSKGEMLSAGSPKTSGGYVAIERVSGTLNGRSGTFGSSWESSAAPRACGGWLRSTISRARNASPS